ncbi:MAG: branched-chain-amino-acid transaminase [Planctomycetes bacterium]|nr:branched-chain-amino-acid transaminase [Planctomycetota bacterium]
MSVCICLNGKFYKDPKDAHISPYDHGFLYGDGIFEGIRVYNGRVFKLPEHMRRLYGSASSMLLKIPYSMKEMEKLIIETCRRTGLKDLYIRLVVSRGIGDFGLDPRKCKKCTVVIMAGSIALYPREKYEKGLKVVSTATRRNRPDSVNAQVKSLNYLNNIMAKIETFSSGADEGIMLNDEGYVSEATADNIFIFKARKQKVKLYTPPPYLGILEGITRNTVIEIAELMDFDFRAEPFTMDDIYRSNECFLTGTGAELIPVIEVDSRQIGDGKPGPLFKRLLKAYQKMTRSEGTPIYK